MNVKLIRLREEHLAMVMDWRMRPYVTKYMNTDPQLTMEGQRKWFASLADDDTQIHWIIIVDEKPVGLLRVMEIDRNNNSCHWGYYVAEKEARSLKLAMWLEWNLYDYVFDVLNLHKLCDDTFTENAGVIQLHLHCGSKLDGVLRDQVYKNGTYHDVSACSILAPEWFEKRPSLTYDKFYFE